MTGFKRNRARTHKSSFGWRASIDVRYCSNSDQIPQRGEMT
jgi:hypothetical protein